MFQGVAGLTSVGTQIGFDYRNDGPCTKESPAIVVKWTDNRTDTYGCASGEQQPAPQDPKHWTRVTFDPRAAPIGTPPISDIRIVFNVPLKSVVLDNFTVITWVIGWPGLSVYVADTGNHRIVRIENWAASGWTANWSSYGSSGSGVGEFNRPEDVAVDALGRIYIADRGNHRIVRINDMNGSGWTTMGTGNCGIAVGEFCEPVSVSVDGGGHIYVAESNYAHVVTPNTWFPGEHRIVRVNDMTGAGWIQYGTFGGGVGQFNAPVAVAYDGAWRLYVADLFNGRVVRIDDMTGAGWTTLTARPATCPWPGMGSGQPFRVALDAAGRIYMLTYGSLSRLNSMNGAGCAQWFPPFDSQAQTYNWAGNGIALDTYNRIYTTDGHPFGLHRIRRMNDMTGAGWLTLGSRGSGAYQFIEPSGIAVVGEGPAPFRP